MLWSRFGTNYLIKVHNDIDSPDKKVKKHGKNDIILSTPDEGVHSENANSRYRDDTIEKLKSQQSNCCLNRRKYTGNK